MKKNRMKVATISEVRYKAIDELMSLYVIMCFNAEVYPEPEMRLVHGYEIEPIPEFVSTIGC